MEGGAFLAQALADRLGTAFLAAHRAAATRPGEATEYRLPCVRDGIGGWQVVIADDAVNAEAVAEAISVPFYAASTIQSQAWAR
jgi:hypothetical protein